MVMGRDSRSEAHGFESRHRILDGHFFTYICCKNCNDVCLKRTKINEKEAGVGPFFLKKQLRIYTSETKLVLRATTKFPASFFLTLIISIQLTENKNCQ